MPGQHYQPLSEFITSMRELPPDQALCLIEERFYDVLADEPRSAARRLLMFVEAVAEKSGMPPGSVPSDLLTTLGWGPNDLHGYVYEVASRVRSLGFDEAVGSPPS